MRCVVFEEIRRRRKEEEGRGEEGKKNLKKRDWERGGRRGLCCVVNF